MNSHRPTFSIVMPIYNEEQFISEALDSILAQTDSDWEAVLVDDGSTDRTPTILDEYAEKDHRFRVFHKVNGGQSTAINKAVLEAQGKWLCWLSGDDFFHPLKLERNRKWIDEHPDKEFFFSGHWLIEPNGNTIDYNLDWLNLENAAYHLITLFRCNYVMGISICIERAAWIRNRGFDESLRHAHDLDMWLRLMIDTPTQYYPDRTCTMRYHAGQETARFPLAPLFDVSKAVIRLINAHTFQDLFPGVNLADRQAAIDVFTRTLDFVASEPTANFYALGYHPALQFRILEWLWGPDIDEDVARALKPMLFAKAEAICAQSTNAPFAMLWKATYAAMNLAIPRFVYQPCDPALVGEIHYYTQHAMGSEAALPLRTYLERYDGLTLDEVNANPYSGREIVLILPDEVVPEDSSAPMTMLWIEVCRRLARAGFSILCVGKSKITFGMMGAFLILGAEQEAEQKQLVMSIPDVDILVTFSLKETLQWAEAKQKIKLTFSPANKTDSEAADEIAAEIKSRLIDTLLLEPEMVRNEALWSRALRKVKYLLTK